MSWYKCNDCGHIFEEGEAGYYSEYMGECHGSPAYEEFSCCPSCGGEYEEAQSCKICGGVFLYDEMSEGLCKECLNNLVADYKYDIKKCYSLSQKNEAKSKVEIDNFLACMFTEKEINEVLYRELVVASSIKPVDCTPFIEEDRYWFDERIAEEVNNNDNR
jgi:hypothetical protein